MKEKKVSVTEDMVSRFHELLQQLKEIEKQIREYKSVFNLYFDQTFGPNEKGRIQFQRFTLTRNIRVAEKFQEEKAVAKLEKMNLADCIKIEKKVDTQKVDAAISLGLLEKEALEDCIDRKYIAVFNVQDKSS